MKIVCYDMNNDPSQCVDDFEEGYLYVFADNNQNCDENIRIKLYDINTDVIGDYESKKAVIKELINKNNFKCNIY
jgi:hypothetical protein